MKQLAALLVLLFILLADCFGQVTFKKDYPGAMVLFSRETSDGGYVFTGQSSIVAPPFINSGIVLGKTDSFGNLLWDKTYTSGVSSSDVSYVVRETPDAGFFLAGLATSNPLLGTNQRARVIKTDSLGNPQWHKDLRTIGSGSCIWNDATLTSSGGYVLTGQSQDSLSGQTLAIACELDALGDTLWTRSFLYQSWCIGTEIDPLPVGGFIMCGYVRSFLNSNNPFLMRLDTNGNMLWDKIYDNGTAGEFHGVAITNDGGFICTGQWESATNNLAMSLHKTDSLGNTLWSNTYGGGPPFATEAGTFVEETSSGGLIACGYGYSFTPAGRAIYVIRANAIGDTLWTRAFQDAINPTKETAYSIEETSDMSFEVGYAGGGSGSLIKIDSQGNTGCENKATPTLIQTPAITVGSGITYGPYLTVSVDSLLISSGTIGDSTLCDTATSCVVSAGIEGADASCSGTKDGSVDITVYAGTSPYTYQWSNMDTIQDLTGLGPGTYTVTITDAAGCTTILSTVVGEPPAIQLSLVLAPSSSSSCNGAMTVLPAAGVAPYTYLWSNGQTNQIAVSLCPETTYCVTVTDANGCTADTCMSVPTGYGEHMNKAEISIHPNPTSAELTIDDFGSTISGLDVLDLTGRVVHQSTSINSSTINLSHLPNGLYLLRLQTGQGVITQRVEVVH